MFNRFCFGALLLVGLAGLLSGCSTTSSSGLTTIVISPSGSSAVTVTLAPPGVAQGHAQFKAIGYYGHAGHQVTKDITDEVTWTSSLTQVAVICTNGSPAPCTPATDGLATATGFTKQGAWTGTSDITASAPGFSGDIVSNAAVFTVTTCTACVSTDIIGVQVIPATQTIAASNIPVQYEAIGTDANGGTHALSSTFAQNSGGSINWVSSNPTVASFTDPTSGLATTGVVAGTSTISATYINADGTAALGSGVLTLTTATGSKEPIVAVAVQPGAQTALSIGATSNFLALATTNAGTSVNLTDNSVTVDGQLIAPAAWSSSNQAVVKIDKLTGIATSTGPGAAVITALVTNPGDQSTVFGQANYTVTVSSTTTAEPFVSLAIVPAAQTLYAVGQTATFLAIGTTASGTTQDLTSYATWTSSNTSVAKSTGTANSETSGQFTAVANGVTAIIANVKNSAVPGGVSTDTTSVTASEPLTVATTATTEPLLSVAIVPSSPPAVSTGQSSQLLAIGTFSAAPTTQDVTAGLGNPAITTTWSSSDTSVATVTTTCPTGLTALSCTISLCPSGSTGATCSTCVAPAVAAGASCATLNPATPPGVVTGASQGTAAIVVVAANPDKSLATNTVPFTVTGGSSGTYTALQIIPNSLGVTSSGQNNQFIALATDASGLNYDVTADVTWKSETPSVATICSAASPAPCTPNLAGQTTAGNAGSTLITATLTQGKTVLVAQATYTLTIGTSPEPLISINIVPGDTVVSNKGMTQQFLAFGTFTTIPTIRDITDSVTWISLDPDVASINTNGTPGEPAGLATAQGYEGLAVIYAENTTFNPDGTLVLSNPQTFTCDVQGSSPPVCDQAVAPALLATLTVFNAGNNNTNWLITAPSDQGVPNLIHCGPGSELAGLGNSVCTGTYAAGNTVTITASLAGQPLNNTFGGWTANCDTTADVPNLTATCTLPTPVDGGDPSGLVGNQSIGALFY
jgi:hypothetical protein